MTLPDDERTLCAEPGCDEPVGLLRITRDLLMLGHRREPKTLHAVRLSSREPRSRTPEARPVDEAHGREPNSAPALEGPPRRARDEARSEPGDRTSVPLRSHVLRSREGRGALPPAPRSPVSAARSTPPGRG